ncbi:MAG: glutamine-hydrolyzing carbamoyl-phosphate synthase small subunit [Candidatus Bipolaricaulia bacterium]
MALLVLEDGSIFPGAPLGASGEVCGEVCFNTGMTGYVEVLTDPSYRGQIVTMTQPHIGNYGVTFEDAESTTPHVSGFIVREASDVYSNWRAELSLDDYLKKAGVIGLSDVDTRALTRHIRTAGAMRGCLSTEADGADALVERARRSPTVSEQDLVGEVTAREIHAWDDPSDAQWGANGTPSAASEAFHVVAYDFGIKHNILRQLRDRVGRVTVVPADTPAERVRSLNPDGIFLSNGPGDPEHVAPAIQAIRTMADWDVPIFGICLGHQLMGLALGARSYKLKFGHRGCNQPVQRLDTGQIEVSTHNHGFALDDLPPHLEVTHLNLNDGTIEGLRVPDAPIFGVQYHPEAAPGPHDSHYLFDRFITTIRERRA